MLPFNSPPAPPQSSSDSSVSDGLFPKNTRLSLNGLFGEATGIDEQMPSTFAIYPSPPPGSYAFGRHHLTSPSKSPTNVMLGAQQSILLSDLAETNTSTNFYQNILCSYVSDYDNRRCTNPAVDNRFCQKHAQLSRIHFPTSGSVPNPQFTCNETPTFQGQGVDVFDGNKSSSQTPIVMSSQPSLKLTGGPTYPSSSTSCPSVVMVDTSPSNNAHQTKKALKFNKNKQASVSNNQPTPINSEVLRTVVDMLNRNRSGLTTKQQIKLLNSLGVIVATVKNPAELASGNVVIQQQSTNNTNHAVFPVPSVQHINNIQPAQGMYMGNQALVPGQSGLNVLTPPSVSPANINQSKLKRKNSSITNAIAAKKVKKMSCDSERSSLQHLTAVELDERVSEALASVGGLTNHQKPVNQTVKPTKCKKKITVDKKPKKTNNRLSISSSSLYVPLNPRCFHGVTSHETSCTPLNKYVQLMKSQTVENNDLFPLGPFCDDQAFGVCRCKLLQYKLQAPTPKRKSLVKGTPKVKECIQCSKCTIQDTEKVSVPFCLSTTLLVSDDNTLSVSTSKEPVFVSPEADWDQMVTSKSQACKPSTASSYGDLRYSGIDLQDSKKDILKTVSTRQMHINSYKKYLKSQISQEKQALRYLCAASKTSSKETAKALRHLGNNSISCKKVTTSVLTSKCMLGGGQCQKPPLPKSCYCSDHIWHCEEQQLFKLDPDMKVVPDIFPDPVVLKPRKKAKVPALSKRKKRKIRKNAAAMKLQGKSDSFEDGLSVNSPNAQSVQVKAENDGNMCQLVNVDDVDDEKMKVIPPNEKSCDSVTSTSMEDAVLDAFNIGDSSFMDDLMPDLLQEFGFTGKNSDVLDNALLLASAVETDYPDQFATDKIGDTTLLFSQANMGHTSCTSKADNGVSSSYQSDNLLGTDNADLASTTLQLPTSSITHCTSSGFNTDDNVSRHDDYMLSLSQTTWSQPSNSQGYDTPYSNSIDDSGNISSSTDQFFEDLSEIEGVLQSLREEVTGDNCSSPMCPKDMDADEYTSILAKEISQYAENQVTSKALLKQQNDQIPATSLNLPITATEPPIHTCDAGAQTNYNSFQTNAFPETSNQFIELSTTKKLRQSPPKKLKQQDIAMSKPLSSDPSSEHVLQIHDENVQRNQNIVTQTSLPGLKVASTSSVGVKQPTPKAETTKGRSGRKPKSSNPVPGYITPGMSPLIAVAQPCRMQPNILAGNVICSPGSVTSSPGNPSMFLIPVNAIVQSGSSGMVAGGPNHVGLALAMPSGQTCIPANFGTVIPVRGSTVVPGANVPQQFIIVNGNQLSNPVAIRANKRQKTTTKHQTNIVTLPSTAVSRASVPIAQQPLSCAIISQASLTLSADPSTTQPTVNSLPTATTNEPQVKWSKPKRSSPLVIPPVISGTHGAQVVAEANLSTTVTAPSIQKLPGDKKSGKCGTVHWNQSTMSTEAAPPLPQNRVYGEAGGQTSNMLYCRRISPSLNNSHQVIVGRLGSLGHGGVSRLAVNERLSQYQKQQNFANSQLKNASEKVKVSGGSEKKTKASPGFINIAKSCKALETDVTCKPTPMEAKPDHGLSTVSETVGASQSKLVAASTSVSGLKRNSRKTEHTETLRDPDFCEVLVDGESALQDALAKTGPG